MGQWNTRPKGHPKAVLSPHFWRDVYKRQTLDSAVMIRFLEQEGENLYYTAGGGITSKSDLQSEYNEMIQKIYVPIY